MRTTSIVIMALLALHSATCTARTLTPQQIGYCIEAGRDNGDTDAEITERCIPSGDSLEDWE